MNTSKSLSVLNEKVAMIFTVIFEMAFRQSLLKYKEVEQANILVKYVLKQYCYHLTI